MAYCNATADVLVRGVHKCADHITAKLEHLDGRCVQFRRPATYNHTTHGLSSCRYEVFLTFESVERYVQYQAFRNFECSRASVIVKGNRPNVDLILS